MNIKDLKNEVIKGTLSDDFLIFVCSENRFLANQYINEICEFKNLTRVEVESLSEIQDTALSLVFNTAYNLNVLSTDKFSEQYLDYSEFKNYIVVCDSIDKSIASRVANYVVEVPKLEEWQIKDYEKILCPGLSDDEIDFIYKVTSGDIYRIVNECSKLSILPINNQSSALSKLSNSKYTDLYSIDSFSLFNSIVDKSLTTICSYLRHKDCCDISPFGLVSLLIGNLKKILYVNFNSGLSPEQIGISQKQYNAIKYYHRNKSESNIVKCLEFLTGLDSKLKLGKLDMKDSELIDYIICSVLSIL